MNGYDFDKTIFHGNSVRRFCIFCCVRLPYLWLLLPELLLAVILYGLKIIGKDAFLRMLEVFVLFVPCKKRFVNKFWDKNFKHVKSWYLQTKQPDDSFGRCLHCFSLRGKRSCLRKALLRRRKSTVLQATFRRNAFASFLLRFPIRPSYVATGATGIFGSRRKNHATFTKRRKSRVVFQNKADVRQKNKNASSVFGLAFFAKGRF